MKIKSINKIIFANIKIWSLKMMGRTKNIIPYKVLINLTDACNSKCDFCEIWKIKPENEINIDHLENFFVNINSNLIWLSFSGGEVTLVKYYYQLVDKIIESCKNLSILAFTTNGLLVKRAFDYAKYAKDKGLDVFVTISLDGDEETHDKLRGVKGNHKKCKKLFKLLNEEGINCTYGITVSDKNEDFINNIKEHINDIRAVTFVHSEGIYNKNNKINDNIIKNSLVKINKNYFIKNLVEIIEKIHIIIGIRFLNKKRNKNIIPCEVLNSSVHLMPSGDIKPCMFMDKIGNIKEDSFIEKITSEKTYDVRKLIKENKCPKCWMNCYSPHSIMQHPIKSLFYLGTEAAKT